MIFQRLRHLLKARTAIYFLIGLFAFIARLNFNFSQELIPGVNGGYYPLQVRSILLGGALSFSDMPFLFYLDAFLVKVISWLGIAQTETLILSVVKVVDSISIPLLLIPLYKIVKLYNAKRSPAAEASISSFAVLSFSPIVLTSDLQKNALAITFLFWFVASMLTYINKKKKNELIVSLLFLILTGLTHFGTFVIALLFLAIILFYEFKIRALLPLVILLGVGLGIIGMFDTTRLKRLLAVASVSFERPALFGGMLSPPDIFIILVSVVLAIAGIVVLIKKGKQYPPYQKAILWSGIIFLILLSCPLWDGEYFRRLSLFLFFPQTLVLLHMVSTSNERRRKQLSISIFAVTFLSILIIFGRPKEPVIKEIAYEDLKNFKTAITPGNETIVVARHGLEWWTAWVLHVKVAQDKAIDGTFFTKYKKVFMLLQKEGFSSDSRRTPFHEPEIPAHAELIRSTKFYELYEVFSLRK